MVEFTNEWSYTSSTPIRLNGVNGGSIEFIVILIIFCYTRARITLA